MEATSMWGKNIKKIIKKNKTKQNKKAWQGRAGKGSFFLALLLLRCVKEKTNNSKTLPNQIILALRLYNSNMWGGDCLQMPFIIFYGQI
jgi:hypothetical protein